VAGGSIRIQLHDTDGTPLGAGIANPLTSAATPFYQTIEPTSSGYRLSGIENISPHNLVHAELDGMGTVAAGQTTFGMINAPGFGAPSSFATTGRSLLVYPYDDGTGSNPTHMRAIQTCGN
jgi:hypothetical protein